MADVEVEEDRDLVDRALNTPAGRLTKALLDELDKGRKAGEAAAPALIGNLVTAAGAPSYSGTLARANLIRNLRFVLSFDVREVNDHLVTAVSGDGYEGRALRKVLVCHGQLSALATRMFGQAILEGAISLSTDERADWAALNLLVPVLDTVRRGPEAEQWGLDSNDAARGFREGSLALREGALEVMTDWIKDLKEGPEVSWRTVILPLLERVWPRDRRFKHAKLSRQFAKLALAAGDAFPEALRHLQPYMTPLEGYSGIYDINASPAPDNYPAETLALLWKLLGPDSQAESHDAPKLLDRLIAADPKLETDRRLQWLEQRYLRYE